MNIIYASNNLFFNLKIMKKFLATLALLSMVFTLSACLGTEVSEDEGATPEVDVVVEPEVVDVEVVDVEEVDAVEADDVEATDEEV